MTVTRLDPESALIVVDLQRGLAGLTLAPQDFPVVVERAASLAAAFRDRGMPVVVVTVDGIPPGRTDIGRRTLSVDGDWAASVDEFAQDRGEIRVVKQTSGAFLRTDLHEQLAESGVTQVVIAGVVTSNGVERTAQEAFGLGYNVVVAVDACADGSSEQHEHSATGTLPRVAETGTTADVLTALAALDAQP